MSSLRDIFTPSKATRIRQLKLLIDLHCREIGNCPTCEYYIPTPPGTPGLMTVEVVERTAKSSTSK